MVAGTTVEKRTQLVSDVRQMMERMEWLTDGLGWATGRCFGVAVIGRYN